MVINPQATDTQYEIKHVERYDAAKNIWEVRAELPVGSYARSVGYHVSPTFTDLRKH